MAGPRVGGRGPHGMMPGEKAKDFKGTMGKLLTYLKKFLPSIILVLVCAAASTIFSIFGPKILGQATTKLFEGLIAMLTGTGSIDFHAIAQILIFLACLYVISALLSYVQGWIMSGVATKLSYSMRKDISEKIDRMPLAYFDRVPHGEVLSRITNEFLQDIGSDIRIRFDGYTVLKSGKVREKISISLLRDGMDCGSFGKFSAGEAARVNLATILAMQKLVNSNCDGDKGLDLLVLDEILEAVDEAGLASMFEALNSLGGTVLVVSHGNVAEGYPHKLVIVKENGESRLGE